MNEMEYEAVEKETRDYLINQRLNYGTMPKDKRLELITTTLLLGGARPNINNSDNDCLYFNYESTKGIQQLFGVEKYTIESAQAFADVMEGIDNAFQIPMEARKSLEARKEYFADRIHDKFSTFDLKNDISFPEIKPSVIDKNWNQTMQGKMAAINDKYKDSPDRFGDFVSAAYTDADSQTTLNRAILMREIAARASVSALKNKDAFMELVGNLDNNFGLNNIIKNVDEVAKLVNKLSMQDAHEFPAVKDME